MAEINVDVILPPPIEVNAFSPSQDVNTNIFLPAPGPQGPPSIINDISNQKIYLFGLDGVKISNSGTDTILISGNENNIKSQINNLSGYVDKENIIGYSISLNSGSENYYINYPYPLNSLPQSISCVFQNSIDDTFYYFNLGSMDLTGFYINFSDILSKNGYILNIHIKK